ncbi:DHA2 family efflux MFS transporter permease subunit [Staphylococcus gallinarum]|jgi:DHA2 family multidrug resistance protein-like MFS transporter|uniref:DHA2 family efflux MFS transporter permease subunit n=1 Tax=Staphylococcus gallinarum TaxID=1293 RepID=A0A2T4T0R2_STAGA|nr:MDR family MFS transporter [Staphylococcus gallinarum]MCD8821392.1 DHA2 family efflux MFS transporter permease subunit [Staphylococcus gallinarum]MCD8826911.1 DHA2 family efflux MFS transporter permease subunit [Staphylococcus gallinarum]MEB6243120.1 DHA2 family efflux MFS transporter permease subunit [Staphylococcus gallinarum]MEB6296193.1 DHA2 family efflux MFS transporter permease subunit [Staphylococcus gallinarum]PTL06826.1 drug:proton antiporter [Staphylococcus gallinarum]
MTQKTRIIMVITMLFGGFFGLLNETLLTTALPSIMKEFDIDYTKVQWLTTAFLLVNGVVVPLSAMVIQRFSTRQVFLTAIIIFLVGTIIGAFSPNFQILLIARIIQALGSGIMMPLMMTTILDVFEPHERGKYMGVFGLVIGLAPAIGPTLSGYLVEYLEWRALFYVVAPVAALTFLASLKYVVNVGTNRRVPIDILSILLSVLGFGGLLYGTSSISRDGWNDPVVLTTMIGGIILVIAFIFRQTRLTTPLLDFSVFKNSQFAVGIIIMGFTMVSMIGSETILPMFVQNIMKDTALQSGLILLPGAIVMGIMSVLSGILFDKFGAKILGIFGMVIVIVTSSYFVIMDEHSSSLMLTIVYAVRMIGIALSLMPLMTHTMNQLPQEMNAHGSSMTNTVQQIAASIGTAGLVTTMSQVSKNFTPEMSNYKGMNKKEMAMNIQHDALLSGYHGAFWFAIIISVISFICVFMLKSKKKLEAE